MASKSVTLAGRHVVEALALADVGTTSLMDWTDTREVGLRIRVRGRRAVWLLKFRTSSLTLGPASRWNVREARELASQARGMLRSDIDPRPWLDARMAGAEAEEAEAVVLRRRGREASEWTVKEVVRRYVDEHLKAGRVVRGERRPPSSRSVRDVETSVLGADTFAPIAELLAREFDARDLERYRDDVLARNGGSTSRRTLANVKAALSWAKRHHGSASGLGDVTGWWRDVNATYTERVRSRMPSVRDIGLTLAIADAFERMPGRAIAARAGRMHVLALKFLVLTAQRRETVCTIRREQVIADERGDREGWGILYVPPARMKGRRAHTIPLSPDAMSVVWEAIELGGDSEHLFPARRSAQDGADVPIAPAALNRRLAQLRGADPFGRKLKSPNLLREVGVRTEDWSPHDIRRTFATEIEDATTRGDAVSAVLDHSQSGARFVDGVSVPDAAAITRIAYSQAQRLPLKRIALEPWSHLVTRAIGDAAPDVFRLQRQIGYGPRS
ncbi:tyrosine-type recombinase/integrase [Aureimonas mangrovi]|uniref:tyrosine-type recombinase/integrase n=1 Tax=Aureimonas mangrovi TaxID=2758041 RepID=UPI00163D82E2|nr:tyrosine-type recombinase/integrase [Aureimonas mangrovi]